MPREPVLRNTCHGPRTSLPQSACHSTDHVQQNISPNRPTRHRLRGERGGRGTTTSRTTTRASNELSPPKSACSGDAVLHTSTRGTVHMGQCAPEDSISQYPFLQMIYTAGNPKARDRNLSDRGRPSKLAVTVTSESAVGGNHLPESLSGPCRCLRYHELTDIKVSKGERRTEDSEEPLAFFHTIDIIFIPLSVNVSYLWDAIFHTFGMQIHSTNCQFHTS